MTIERKPKVKNFCFTLGVAALAVTLASGFLISCGDRNSSGLATQVAAIEVAPDGVIDAPLKIEAAPNTWKAPAPADPPPPLPLAPSANSKWGHAMAFDINNNVTVLFGGNTGATVVQDTWTWNGTDWTNVSGVGPPAREDHAMAYDIDSQVVVLYGGSDISGNPLGDTWEWNGSAWTQQPVSGPGQRSRHAMVYDSSQEVVVLYGGFSGGLNWETWIWNGVGWQEVTNATFPGPRENHSMAFDNLRGVTVLFGGDNGSTALQDTWELSYNSSTSSWDWVERTPATTSPPARLGHSMDFDTRRGVVVLFGGEDGAGATLSDTTWEWDGSDWAQVMPYDDPGERTNHAMAFDEIREVSVLYGGDDGGGNPLEDTWEYPFLIDGQDCADGVECYSGICIDGVCCESDCGTDTDDCRACSVAAGSSTDGLCETIAADLDHVCRASSGDDCDPAETCNGSDDTCPVDSYLAEGDPCGDTSDTNCDKPDTCNASGTCLENLEPDTTVCRPVASDCDVEEKCDGAGACPVDLVKSIGTACGSDNDDECDNPDTCNATGTCLDNYEGSGTACGDSSDSICDNPDTCNGSGTCLDNFEEASFECRGAAGDCDVAENCDGAGACPADDFEPEGTGCGDPTDTNCTNPDTCDGTGTCLDNHEPPTLLCRAAAGDCDLEELCDGAGGCPVDIFVAQGTACGSDSDTDCDNPDTCNGAGVCLDNFEPADFECREAAGDCDVAENCDGAGACPVDGFEPEDTPCGDETDDECTNPDTCNDEGTCLDNHEPDTTVCREDAGACDVEELCDGAGACPEDVFEAEGTACGDGSDTDCTNPDTCNATGLCLSNHEPTTLECRASAGECDAAENCDGAGDCPVDAFVPEGIACGSPVATTCNNPDTCDGLGACLDNFEPDTLECRPEASDCDVPEFCDGVGDCPVDIVKTLGTPCGDPSDTDCTGPDTCNGGGVCQENHAAEGIGCGDITNTVCSDPDTCDGGGSCQPNDEPITTECRTDTGECDVAEFCDGAGACPDDGFDPPGTACGDSTVEVCNAADTCDGTGACLQNFEETTVECRAAATDCDVAENCDGAGNCPADLFQPAGSNCGSDENTSCTNPDTCDAAGTCLENNAPDTTECRPAVNDCDVAELCDGGGACPQDGFVAVGLACGDNLDDACTDPDTCNGAGDCLDNHEPIATVCRASTDVCDPAENCDGSGACPADLFEPDGSDCNDQDECSSLDTCNGGVCLAGATNKDDDNDGFYDGLCDNGNDCNDNDENVNPGVVEASFGEPVCEDNIDNDCDSLIDTDGNGGDPDSGCLQCTQDSDCNDNNVCNGIETCNVGVGLCEAGTVLDCDDENTCTTDSCDPVDGCANVPNTNSCDDGDACTIDDVCAAGACSGTNRDCTDGNICTTDSCDSATGCVNTDNTEPCDDGDACTENDTCASGECVSGSALDCDDGNICTSDSCNSATGCVNTDNTEACDDGDACTVNDICTDGACVSGPALVCDDSNVCTTDSCDTASGCVFTNNAEACEDGDACTENDTCADGACESGSARSCDDDNLCTSDSCDSATGCVNTNNTEPCDDGDTCTTADTCADGACVSGPALVCDDINVCTTDTCDASSGCVNTNNTENCDDGNDCSTTDTCSEGVCVAGAIDKDLDQDSHIDAACLNGTDCNDDDAQINPDIFEGPEGNATCSDSIDNDCDDLTDTSDPTCLACSENADCDDDDVCNGSETCVNNECVAGTALDCDDGNFCTTDTCSAINGCKNTNNALACDDNDECTSNDFCADGVCTGSEGACKDDGGGCGCRTKNRGAATAIPWLILGVFELIRRRRRN